MYDEIIDALMEIMQPHCPLPIRRSTLPTGAGVCIEHAASDTITTHFDRATLEEMTCVLNAKGESLREIHGILTTLHHLLTRLRDYPQTDLWQVTAVETIGGPTNIGREPNGLWLSGSSIRVKFYDKTRSV